MRHIADAFHFAALAAAAKSPDTLSSLLKRFQAGEITCAAHAASVIRRGQRSEFACVRRVQQPGDFHPSTVAPDVSLPGSWVSHDCGLSLSADYVSEDKAITLFGHVEWDTAPVLPFGKPGVAIPDMDTRRCRQKLEFRELTLKPGQPVIADVRASNAREGTPEHGRWHVLVLLAR